MSEQSERMMVASDPLLAFDSGDGVCPFCAEGGFDLVGLKGHLLRGWCDKFNKTGLDVPRTLDGHVGDIERAYCLICRREMMTEAGHICPSCSDETVKLKKGSDFC